MMNSTAVYVLLVAFDATPIRPAFGFGEALFAVPLLALRLPLRIRCNDIFGGEPLGDGWLLVEGAIGFGGDALYNTGRRAQSAPRSSAA
jgi:hypothetical protein